MEVIIVDDELVSLTVLKQLAEKLPDCDVRGFTEATDALAWCEGHDPDLVIVDYMMPGMNGIEFAQRLRVMSGKAETPVLMVTASGDGEVRNDALVSGINDFLNKPFDFVELQARATNMLALRASHRKPMKAESAAEAPSAGHGIGKTRRVLDLNATRARLAADDGLLGEIASIFVRTAPELLASIQAALSGNDLKRAFGQAHSLKGAVAAFEAPEVFNSLARLETHAKNADGEAAMASFGIAQTLVAKLFDELAPVVARNAPRQSRT